MKKYFYISIIALVLLSIIGCTQPYDSIKEPTYTVCTSNISIYEFNQKFPYITLNDGYYYFLEVPADSNAEWDEILQTVPSNSKNDWPEEQIKKWLLGRNFDTINATKVTDWIVTCKHCVVFVRISNTVYLLVK